MLLRKILHFYGLLLKAIWLDMLSFLVCILSVSIVTTLADDYLKSATQKGLDYVRKLGIPFLENEIKSLDIPDVKGTTSTPIGAVLYGLSSIAIKNVSIPKSNMTIDGKTGLTISCGDAYLEVTSKWRYKEKSWPHIKDSGSVNIEMRQIQLDITFFLDTHNEKKPTVETRKCLLDIGKLKLSFHGGASWLYNLFANPIAADLKGLIAKEVCHAVSTLIDEEGDKFLLKIPEVVQTIKAHIQQLNQVKNTEVATTI